MYFIYTETMFLFFVNASNSHIFKIFPTLMWATEATTNESEGHWWFICGKVVNTQDCYLGNWHIF